MLHQNEFRVGPPVGFVIDSHLLKLPLKQCARALERRHGDNAVDSTQMARALVVRTGCLPLCGHCDSRLKAMESHRHRGRKGCERGEYQVKNMAAFGHPAIEIHFAENFLALGGDTVKSF